MGAKCQRELYRNWGQRVRSESFGSIWDSCDVIRTLVPKRVWHTFRNLNNFFPKPCTLDFLFDMGCLDRLQQYDMSHVGLLHLWRHQWRHKYWQNGPFFWCISLKWYQISKKYDGRSIQTRGELAYASGTVAASVPVLSQTTCANICDKILLFGQ